MENVRNKKNSVFLPKLFAILQGPAHEVSLVTDTFKCSYLSN